MEVGAMKKRKVDKTLNTIIIILIVAIIAIGSIFFIRSSLQDHSEKKNTVSKVEKKSSSKKHKQKHKSTKRTEQGTDKSSGSSTSYVTTQEITGTASENSDSSTQAANEDPNYNYQDDQEKSSESVESRGKVFYSPDRDQDPLSQRFEKIDGQQQQPVGSQSDSGQSDEYNNMKKDTLDRVMDAVHGS